MRPLFALALLLLGSAAAVRADDSERQPDGSPKKPCVSVTTSAPYVNYGYDHVVTLHNSCPKPQSCTVKTDVALNPVPVELAASGTESIVTFRGSPSREFKADVSCQPAG